MPATGGNQTEYNQSTAFTKAGGFAEMRELTKGRRSVKWVATVLCALILTSYLASFGDGFFTGYDGIDIGISDGAALTYWPPAYCSENRGLDEKALDALIDMLWDAWDTSSLLPAARLERPMGFIKLPLWPLVVAPGAWTAMLWGRWWRDRRRAAMGLCHECGYNLKGNVSGRCPECGTPHARAASTP